MKRILSILLFLSFVPLFCLGQNVDSMVQWHYSAQKTGDNTFEINIKATIVKDWHVYTQHPGGDGSQIPTEVNFIKNDAVKLDGKIKAIGKIVSETADPVGTYYLYKNTVTFKQKITATKNTVLKGYVSFQTCNEEMCLPPADDSFSIPLKGVVAMETGFSDIEDQGSSGISAIPNSSDTDGNSSATGTSVSTSGGTDANSAAQVAGNKDSTVITQANNAGVDGGDTGSLWGIFLTGLLAGLAAFITPCIYAMLPITVSFFTKRSKDKATGLRNAAFYSLSIIAIFLLIGLLISVFFSETTMYFISTSVAFNLFVFAIFALFGISLLGAFEITLPASWSSKLDKRASGTNLWGIFFMALVLVVVSFSCTSAFISFLIVRIVQAHDRLGGLIGFLGFGGAIALPFALFAFFPGWLNNIAKSGGWLNSVKVTMGFVELAMAMKFLSNVDLQYHWHLLDYNIYLAIWIILFSLLGFYLLGKLKFSHDDGLPKNMFGERYLSVTRLFFAMISLVFAVYMIPGMFGAPLLGISGWLPEKKTLNANFYDKLEVLNTRMLSGGSPNTTSKEDNKYGPKKYTDFLTSELPGVTTYFDYKEALTASKALKKPVLLDFTGHSCVNCRKMEAAVLSQPSVLSRLSSDFILASLYTDERNKLAPEDQYTNKDGKKIKTIGEQNIDLEVKYGEVAQPFYIFVDSDGNIIQKAGGYVPDVDRFLKIMDQVEKQYKEKSPNAVGTMH